MKFELFQECQTATRDYYNRYWQMLKEVELADELGWDSYGMSEQHFTPSRILIWLSGNLLYRGRDAHEKNSNSAGNSSFA